MSMRARHLCLILAAAAAAPAALAGQDIMKCVDSAGHVTLTDQPCPRGARALRLPVRPKLPPAVTAAQLRWMPAARYVAPAAQLQRGKWRPSQARHRAQLTPDVSTLKAARAQQLVQDEAKAATPRLAVN